MLDRTERIVEGRTYVTSGSLDCPHPELCDVTPSGIRVLTDGPVYEAYVRRHCEDHGLGKFRLFEDAERNLGVWCFYFFHKFVWGNPELAPIPHWEIHAFVSTSVWNEDDLQSRVPLAKRKDKDYLPPTAERREGEYRRFKQVEVPRQCQKTSIGSRAYVLFRSLHEYFINDKANFRILLRSAVSTLSRQSLTVIRRMARGSQKISRLYGAWVAKCKKCGASRVVAERVAACVNAECGSDRVTHRRISLYNNEQGSGATGTDTLSFRWLTDGADADAVAAYNVYATGLETENTGQRPDLYVWDDPQTEKNSNTIEKRKAINAKFEASWRELQFGGEMLVFDTRKYMNDFASSIQNEPLATMFHALRREVRWRTEGLDAAPWVLDGWRYYYPLKGNGQRALDAKEVKELKKQKTFSAEYMNNPIDEENQKFKRSDFIIIPREAAPPEIRYGLGCEVSTAEQMELDRLRVKIRAMNACDPAGDGTQKKTGDDNFGVAHRLDRHAKVYLTKMAAGHWGSKQLWDEIEKLSTYNAAAFTDYEMPASETHIREAFDKWVREKAEELEAMGIDHMVRPPIVFSHMPKSSKDSRIDQMENYLPIYILEDAASPDLIEKYIMQWIARGIEDHDDGPDATSRLIKHFRGRKYNEPEEPVEDKWSDPNDGASYVTLGQLKQMANRTAPTGLWGAGGR